MKKKILLTFSLLSLQQTYTADPTTPEIAVNDLINELRLTMQDLSKKPRGLVLALKAILESIKSIKRMEKNIDALQQEIDGQLGTIKDAEKTKRRGKQR